MPVISTQDLLHAIHSAQRLGESKQDKELQALIDSAVSIHAFFFRSPTVVVTEAQRDVLNQLQKRIVTC